jgi:hypothetical protein
MTVYQILFELHATQVDKSHSRAGATLDFLLSLKANKEMFEQNLNVSFL